MRSTSPKIRGLTLAELLIGITILGILAGLAFTSIQSQWQRERITSTAQELMGWLESSRRMSLRGASCKADIADGSVNLGGTLAKISSSTSNCSSIPNLNLTGITNGYTISVSSTGLDESLKLSQSITSITFTPRGTIDTSTGASNKVIMLTLQPGGAARCISIRNLVASMQMGKISGGNCDTTSGY